jgi:hypothetical protein
MKAGIIGSFSLSALLFVLAFLTREDGGYMSVILLFFGIVLAGAGVLLSTQAKK